MIGAFSPHPPRAGRVPSHLRLMEVAGGGEAKYGKAGLPHEWRGIAYCTAQLRGFMAHIRRTKSRVKRASRTKRPRSSALRFSCSEELPVLNRPAATEATAGQDGMRLVDRTRVCMPRITCRRRRSGVRYQGKSTTCAVAVVSRRLGQCRTVQRWVIRSPAQKWISLAPIYAYAGTPILRLRRVACHVCPGSPAVCQGLCP